MDIATTAAALAVISAVWEGSRRVFKFQQRVEETLKPDSQGKSISDRMNDMTSTVAEIKHQVLTNGGGSLRDSVERMAVDVKDAKENAKDAAEKATRAELAGNFERADIRRKLGGIEGKLDKYATDFSAHLAESKVRTEVFEQRVRQVEKRSA